MLSNYIIGIKNGCRLSAEINIDVFFNEAKLMALSVIGMSIPGTTFYLKTCFYLYKSDFGYSRCTRRTRTF